MQFKQLQINAKIFSGLFTTAIITATIIFVFRQFTSSSIVYHGSVTFQFYFSEGPGFSLLERLPTLGTTGFFIQPAAEKNILKHLCEPSKRFREQNVLMAGGTRQYMGCLQRATDWPCSLL